MITVSSAESLPRARSSVRRLARPVSKSVDADSASRSCRPLSCRTYRVSSRKGARCRSRRARAALPGGAAASSGSTVAECDVELEHARVVRVGRDQMAAELVDQVLGDAPSVAAIVQPEQGTRRLVHSAGHLVVRLRRRFGVLAQSWPLSGAPALVGAQVKGPPARSAIRKQRITADSCAARPVRRMRNPCVGNPMFLRSHITAETVGLVPPRHHLEDAWPRDIPPGLQPLETRGLFDEVQTLAERALKSLRALRRDGNLTTHDEATVAVLACHAAARCHRSPS